MPLGEESETTFCNLVEILCKRIDTGEKAKVCKEIMQPILDRMKEDCFQEFLAGCKNYYQNIDNSADIMVKSKMKVVELFESALNNAVRTGKDAEEQLGKEANHGR